MCFGSKEEVVYVQGQGPAPDGTRPMTQDEYAQRQKQKKRRRSRRGAALSAAAGSGA